MKVIDKIHIRYFRSIKDGNISKINEVNVFSGGNDSGKSNVLKALNLFFNNETNFLEALNFDEEFSRERLDEVRKKSIKGKQFIAVKIFFYAPIGHKNLPKKFYVEKSWDRDNKLLAITDNVISQFNKGLSGNAKSETAAKRALSSFLNSVHYQYIPAIRSPKIFEKLLNLLQILLLSKNKKNIIINKLLSEINEEAKKFTQNISKNFEKISGIKSNIKIPGEFKDFFRSFFIDTETGKFDIPLKLRGDGIQMRYIPTILDYIAKNSRGIFIWGFDEPENSTEYSLCSQMAEDFKNIFSQNAQIFISTHSFHFTTLKGSNVSTYRVYKDDQNINSLISYINDKGQLSIFGNSDMQKINEEIGVLDLHKEIALEYKEWQKNKNNWLNDYNKLKTQIETNDSKPILFVEGKTDKKILITAWKKLRPKQKIIPINIVAAFDCYFIVNTFKRGDIFRNDKNKKFLGMLDFDDAHEKWKELINSKNGNPQFEEKIKDKSRGITVKHINNNGFVFLLPVPNFRNEYADPAFGKSYLSIELLFSDEILNGYTKEIPLAGDIKLKKFIDSKKDDFSKKVESFNKNDFKSFEPILTLIDELIKK